MAQTGAQTVPRDRTRTLIRWAVVATGLMAGFFVLRLVGGYVPVFAEWVKGLGPWGPVVFMLGYVVAVVAFLPALILTISAGVIFGLLGTLYVFVGASVGAILAFLISRHFARGLIERRIQGDPRFAAVDRAVGAQGFKIMFLLRLSPFFPFVFLNYALGLTRVRLSHYVLALFGILPGSLLYVYLGYVAGDVAAVTGGATVRGTEYYLVRVIGLAATLVVTIVVTRIARRALRDATGQ